MKVLIDTNVFLDVMLERYPFYDTSVEVMRLAKYDEVEEFVSASSITDIYYIAMKQIRDRDLTKSLLAKMLVIVQVLDVGRKEVWSAIQTDWKDFEDSVQWAVAKSHDMDIIVTRNPRDYGLSDITIMTPSEFIDYCNS